MEYKVTYMDGSEAYLMHSGVKGMKWGVWNEETRSRYLKTVKNPSVAKANAKFAAKSLGAGAAMAVAGATLGSAGLMGTGGNPVAGRVAAGAGVGAVYGALESARSTARNKRIAEIEQAKINKGEKTVKKIVDQKTVDSSNKRSSTDLRKESKQTKQTAPEKKHENILTSDAVNNARQSKAYKDGAKQGQELLKKFAVDKNSPQSRKQVIDARDGLAKLANKELAKGNVDSALNSMAKAEVFDAWLNSNEKK